MDSQPVVVLDSHPLPHRRRPDPDIVRLHLNMSHARGWCDSHYRWSRDNGWAEPDHLLPVTIDVIRMRRLDGGFAYGYGRRQRPPATS